MAVAKTDRPWAKNATVALAARSAGLTNTRTTRDTEPEDAWVVLPPSDLIARESAAVEPVIAFACNFPEEGTGKVTALTMREESLIKREAGIDATMAVATCAAMRLSDGVSTAATFRNEFLAARSEAGNDGGPPKSAEKSAEKGLGAGPSAVTAANLVADRVITEAGNVAPEVMREATFIKPEAGIAATTVVVPRAATRLNDGISVAATLREKLLATRTEDGNAVCPPKSAEKSAENGLMLGPGAVIATTLSVDRLITEDCAPDASAETEYVAAI